ncbi:MAG: transposase [Flavobacteriaceae bacterium]|nr:transposase [Flavobacteriaceae bacterium]
MLKETVEDTQEYLIISKDTDEKIGYKSDDSSFFGCKTYVVMSEERIVTAVVVTSGEKGDFPVFPESLKISLENGIGTIIGDGAYLRKNNLTIASM